MAIETNNHYFSISFLYREHLFNLTFYKPWSSREVDYLVLELCLTITQVPSLKYLFTIQISKKNIIWFLWILTLSQDHSWFPQGHSWISLGKENKPDISLMIKYLNIPTEKCLIRSLHPNFLSLPQSLPMVLNTILGFPTTALSANFYFIPWDQ